MLYMIGLGLSDVKDITIRGLEAVKNCEKVYLENYTSVLSCLIADLEKFYGKKIIPANREIVENSDEILDAAEQENVAFLVIGDVFSATTHIDLYLEAKKRKIETGIIHNASVISAVGVTGLQVYKFGKITSIPLENKDVTAPYDVLVENQKAGLHTLFLLDLHSEKKEFLTIKKAIEYLLKVGGGKKTFTDDALCIGCSQIGGDAEIKVGKAKELLELEFTNFPQCLIVPGKLHFKEEEALQIWK